MTSQEENYLLDCEFLLQILAHQITGMAGARAIAVNTLTEHIRKVRGSLTGPQTASDNQMGYIIGLTFADIMQLRNGGTLQVNPKELGLVDLPITILLGGTDEHMAKGLAKHPDAKGQIIDSHGEQKN